MCSMMTDESLQTSSVKYCEIVGCSTERQFYRCTRLHAVESRSTNNIDLLRHCGKTIGLCKVQYNLIQSLFLWFDCPTNQQQRTTINHENSSWSRYALISTIYRLIVMLHSIRTQIPMCMRLLTTKNNNSTSTSLFIYSLKYAQSQCSSEANAVRVPIAGFRSEWVPWKCR